MTDQCMCGRCHPTAAANQCSVCGQEVRWGTRDGVLAYHHREAVDHGVIHGHRRSAAQAWADEMTYLWRPFVAEDGSTYTAALYDIRKDKDTERRKRRLAEYMGEDPDYVEPIPEPEQRAHDVDPDDFAPRSGIKQVINLIRKSGWDLVAVRHARGPYLGSNGEVLSISDTHVVKARSPERLDGGVDVAVGSWRDGKFDFAYTGTILGGRLSPTKVDATTMKNWIKGHREPNPSEDDDRPGLSVPGLDPGSE